MKSAIGLQYSSCVRRVALTAVLLVLTIALGLNLAVIFRDSALVPPTPTESTSPEKDNSHKTGPWHHSPMGARV
jgi:hypothetical protein